VSTEDVQLAPARDDEAVRGHAVRRHALHTEEFRRLERLWPNHAALDRELDALHEKYGIEYWR